MAAPAAGETKAQAAQAAAPAAKPNEAVGKIAMPEPKSSSVPKAKAKWSNPNTDLTPCLEKDSNTAVIKCAE